MRSHKDSHTTPEHIALALAHEAVITQRRYAWAQTKGLSYVAHAIPSPKPDETDIWWVRYHIPNGPTDTDINVHVDVGARRVVLVYDSQA
jgi:hypothetical protein